ncbi:unnamed protein product, partial [Ectocarpus sp. 13 AM-2016]
MMSTAAARCNIQELLELEKDIRSNLPSLDRDAKVNLLKYLQAQRVQEYQVEYDRLYFTLSRGGNLECLRRNNMAAARFKPMEQPKKLGLQEYLADAQEAQPHLDKLIEDVVATCGGCEGRFVGIKSPDSVMRKAERFNGNVGKIADMARAAVVCGTPDDLERAYTVIMARLNPQDVLRVKNGFSSDWMPSGYRDVKVNPVVNGHLCEIQLHLREFFELKDGQHTVYEWARELPVTTETDARYLFDDLSSETLEEMIRLAEVNWAGAEHVLPSLQLYTGKYVEAEEAFRKLLAEAEEQMQGAETNSEEWRNSLVNEAQASTNLGLASQLQGQYSKAAPLLQRSLKIREDILGKDHPDVARSLQDYADLLTEQGKFDEAMPLFTQSMSIREKALGPGHPEVGASLISTALLLDSQAEHEKAYVLHRKAVDIFENLLSADHPFVAMAHINRAVALDNQGKYEEADALLACAQGTLRAAHGSEHPMLVRTENIRAKFLARQ